MLPPSIVCNICYMLSLSHLKMFSEHVFKGIKLINSSLIFFHIDHLLGHFFSDCFDNHQIISLLILICLGIEAFKSWVTLLSCLHFTYTFNHHLGGMTWKKRRLWTDMSWFRFQLFCLTADQWRGPHSFSVSLSVKWGQYLLCILLWGLEIMSIRVQHRASCTDLTLQDLREAMFTCTNNGT